VIFFYLLSCCAWSEEYVYSGQPLDPTRTDLHDSQLDLRPLTRFTTNHDVFVGLGYPSGNLQETLQNIRFERVSRGTGMFDRFYNNALQSSEDSALYAWPQQVMPGMTGPHSDPRLSQFIEGNNTGQMKAILQNSIARSFIQEVLGNGGSGLYRPVAGSTADYQWRLQSGVDFGVGPRFGGFGANVNWRLFGLQLSAGVSTGGTNGTGLDPIQLSKPFLDGDFRGEVGVNSRGEAFLFMMTRW
jgi:hypothetical protein